MAKFVKVTKIKFHKDVGTMDVVVEAVGDWPYTIEPATKSSARMNRPTNSGCPTAQTAILLTKNLSKMRNEINFKRALAYYNATHREQMSKGELAKKLFPNADQRTRGYRINALWNGDYKRLEPALIRRTVEVLHIDFNQLFNF